MHKGYRVSRENEGNPRALSLSVFLSFYAIANQQSSACTTRASKEMTTTHRPSLHPIGGSSWRGNTRKRNPVSSSWADCQPRARSWKMSPKETREARETNVATPFHTFEIIRLRKVVIGQFDLEEQNTSDWTGRFALSPGLMWRLTPNRKTVGVRTDKSYLVSGKSRYWWDNRKTSKRQRTLKPDSITLILLLNPQFETDRLCPATCIQLKTTTKRAMRTDFPNHSPKNVLLSP